MGRRSEMTSLVRGIEASGAARERMTVMLLTLAGQWSVREGYERLGMRRTRFQDLRRQMLEAAVGALEGGVAGRPRRIVQSESRRIGRLRVALEETRQELGRVRAQLDIAESGAGEAARARRERKLAQGAPGRN